MSVFGDAIGAAERTDAFVALENALAQMARVAAETPFFDAKGGTEGLAACWHLELAPPAETTAVGTFGQVLLGGPTAGHGAFIAHRNRIELNGRSSSAISESWCLDEPDLPVFRR